MIQKLDKEKHVIYVKIARNELKPGHEFKTKNKSPNNDLETHWKPNRKPGTMLLCIQ